MKFYKLRAKSMKFYQANGSACEDSAGKFSALDPPIPAGTAHRILVEVPLIESTAPQAAQRDPGQFLSAQTPFLKGKKKKTSAPDLV